MIRPLGEAGRGGARREAGGRAGVHAEAGACVITAGTGILVRHAWRAEGIEFQFAFLCMMSSWHVACCIVPVACQLSVACYPVFALYCLGRGDRLPVLTVRRLVARNVLRRLHREAVAGPNLAMSRSGSYMVCWEA